MIIDSSAVVAILRQEPDAQRLAEAIAAKGPRYIAAPTFLEICMVIAGRRSDDVLAEVEQFIRDAEITILPFSAAAARVAINAFLRYGKGRHPASLNFGDCISYAMAKTEAMPLLFKGGDFRLTDVEAVV